MLQLRADGNETQEALPPLRRSQCHGQKRRSTNAGIAWRRAFLEGQQIEENVWGRMAEGKTEEAKGQEESRRKVKMAVYKQPKSKYWWYKFVSNGEPIRESTKQTNKRVAEQMEAAHRTALAKGEVGIRERKIVPTLAEFAERDFRPFVAATFSAKIKTRKYYEYGVKSLMSFEKLASARLDSITTETIAAFAAVRKSAGI